MVNCKIEDVEGIGPVFGGKLRTCGVEDTDALLAKAKTPALRKALAEKAEISPKQILKFANMVDLYRVNGIGSEYAQLLEVAGVDTVAELAQRRADALTAKMAQVNEAKKHARRAPNEAEVAKWIEQAKTLPRALEY